MKKSFLLTLTTITLFCYVLSAQTRTVNKTEIKISTTDSTFKINNSIIVYNLDSIQKVLGNPSRVEVHKFNSYMEDFPADEGDSPYIHNYVVTNYYYIYDQLGIMFYTQNSEYGTKEPVRCSIHFKNKRLFTNRDPLPFEPKNSFSGVLKINDMEVNPSISIVPKSVNYKTNDFEIFKTSFSSTSIATVIDGIYAYNSKPCLHFFLDNEKDQRISYLVIY